ncbi:MAG: V-type ATP synthase subunit E [Clostridiales bacterium]|nr:V-type ATP synthase subunit E [Clostridiales bacterium]
MSGLDNILKKISQDAQEAAAKIEKDASDKAELEKAKVIEEANAEGARILAEADVLAQRTKEQIVTGTGLKVRNEKLTAKQEIIDRVFAESLKRLNNMEFDDFENFIAAFLSKAEIKQGDSVILPEKYLGLNTSKISAKLSPYTGERTVTGGFILVSGGIEQNNTFAALLDFNKSDLEPLVIKELF